MSESAGRPADSRPAATYDVRDDFDDEFGQALSPREVARRRLFVPGVALVVIGVLCFLGVFGVAAAIFVRHFGRNVDISDPVLVALLLAMIVVGWGLFAIVVAGGISMLRLRGHRTALVGAYIVTGLSIMGLYAILLYPFGLWALIVLYRPEIRREFRPAPHVDV